MQSTELTLSCAHLNTAALSRRIEELSEERCAAVRRLAVSSNELESLPETVTRLVALEACVASFNRIGGPAPLELLPDTLRSLLLAHNGITSLPAAALRRLTRLEVLDLSHNRLDALPPTIGELRGLLTLDVSHNSNLRDIPFAVCACAALRTLNLEGCDVRLLPWNVDNLTALTVLRLGGNTSGNFLPCNHSGRAQVRHALVAILAPMACQKACQGDGGGGEEEEEAFLTKEEAELWCVHTFRKRETGAFGRIPRDVMKIIVRHILKSRAHEVWLKAKPRRLE